MGYTASGYADGESYNFHFPDGNATIARLLVRRLIPEAIPGHTVDDVVTARANYAALDRPEQPTRIRLSSIVVGARNTSEARPEAVEIAYTRADLVHKVTARHCILACYNMMIPYLCPELPEAQKQALHYLVKIPLVYASVAIRSYESFRKLGVHQLYAPGSYFSSIRLNPKTSIGGYDSVTLPDSPALIMMVRTPALPGLDERAQHRAGRQDMLATSFATFEQKIREELGAALGPGGFDPSRDITAITVNRWPHGYAYEYNPLFDPQWPPGQAPHEIGRARFGRIRNRQLRCGSRGLYGFRDRPGTQGGAGNPGASLTAFPEYRAGTSIRTKFLPQVHAGSRRHACAGPGGNTARTPRP